MKIAQEEPLKITLMKLAIALLGLFICGMSAYVVLLNI